MLFTCYLFMISISCQKLDYGLTHGGQGQKQHVAKSNSQAIYSNVVNQDYINQVKSDPLFEALMTEHSYNVCSVTDTVYSAPWSGTFISYLENDYFTTPKTTATMVSDFVGFGITNSVQLFNYLENFNNVTEDLVQQYGTFGGLTQPEVHDIYVNAALQFIEENQQVPTGDACSQYYAIGMDQCAKALTLHLWEVAVGGTLTGIFGTPLAGATVIMTGLAFAYTENVICRQGVVAEWRVCRNQLYQVPVDQGTYPNKFVLSAPVWLLN